MGRSSEVGDGGSWVWRWTINVDDFPWQLHSQPDILWRRHLPSGSVSILERASMEI